MHTDSLSYFSDIIVVEVEASCHMYIKEFPFAYICSHDTMSARTVDVTENIVFTTIVCNSLCPLMDRDYSNFLQY